MRKGQLILTATLLVVASAGAGMTVSDDFNGGFDQSWVWVANGDAQAAVYADGLRLYSPAAYGATSIGGYVAATYGQNSFVSALVNANGAATGNDQGVLSRLQDGNRFYGLNYDPFFNKIQLIYNEGSSFVNLAGQSLGGANGVSGQAVELRLQVMKFGQIARLIGQAWSADGSTLLGQVQEVITGQTAFEGVVVPVLGAGVSGVYAALNMNEYIETGGLSPLDVRMDNFLVRTDTLYGDANLDGVVNEADYGVLVANWGTGNTWSQGDFNFDSAVDTADFEILREYWGGAGPAPTTIPEPTTLGLLALGAPLALRYGRRK